MPHTPNNFKLYSSNEHIKVHTLGGLYKIQFSNSEKAFSKCQKQKVMPLNYPLYIFVYN